MELGTAWVDVLVLCDEEVDLDVGGGGGGGGADVVVDEVTDEGSDLDVIELEELTVEEETEVSVVGAA